MTDFITVQNVTFTLGILGVMFTVYNYFRTPQEDLDKRQAITEKEIDGKAALLAQQVQLDKESTERRFSEIQKNVTDAMTLAQNHIHTVDTKVDTLTGIVTQMGKDVVKISTILEERIPKR